jgi:minimal PKS chain-length factor (CLF/KS beta)
MVTSVVTGLGVVAPTGIGARSHWDSVLAGKSGIGRITRFDPSGYPVRLSGEVLGFEARDLVPGRLIPQTGRWTHLGLVAAGPRLGRRRAGSPRLDRVRYGPGGRRQGGGVRR